MGDGPNKIWLVKTRAIHHMKCYLFSIGCDTILIYNKFR